MDFDTPTKDEISEFSLTSKRSSKVPPINMSSVFQGDSKPFFPEQDSQRLGNLSTIYQQTDRN